MAWLVLVLVTVIWTSVEAVCRVRNGKECVFPFRHKNVTYAGCTDDRDPNGRLWCSTEVDSQGEHLGFKKAWGHCLEDCPKASDRINPDCRSLVVTDEDEDFSSGVYLVDQTRTTLGRAVYINREKELLIFWLKNGAGWGIGYESGLSSGGSFYSSGPDVMDEPWLGIWAEPKLRIVCSVDLPFIDSVSTIPQVDNKCSDAESCLTRENCPAVENDYKKLLGKRKDDPISISVTNILKGKVCNTSKKGFCCPEQDTSVCKSGESCRSIDNCSSNQRKLEKIKSGSIPYSEVGKLYKDLKGRVCDSRNKMFCCSGK
eukprot:TRINITY_DN53176_c0_g1_i1.p1 TRINITY_DN53176_c0_g1~~TRINITY_DN53176_c0_g1_i1.p1  ORF type:complete len:315 (+),score=66.61 TRINITY_DN53176_c0_g1_i1:72-1016(+)